jgi:hypothetical protein
MWRRELVYRVIQLEQSSQSARICEPDHLKTEFCNNEGLQTPRRIRVRRLHRLRRGVSTPTGVADPRPVEACEPTIPTGTELRKEVPSA